MAKKYIFLFSEAFVRSNANVNDEIAGKFLQTSMRESQEVGLQSIIGSRLLRKLQEMVGDNSINDTGNEVYRELINRAQWYLLYSTVARLIPIVGVHISNFGLSVPQDENMQALNRLSDIFAIEQYYINKADFFAHELQLYLIDNYRDFPELTANKISQLRSNLYSAASCGLWLGGARGKGRSKRYWDIRYNLGYDKPF